MLWDTPWQTEMTHFPLHTEEGNRNSWSRGLEGSLEMSADLPTAYSKSSSPQNSPESSLSAELEGNWRCWLEERLPEGLGAGRSVTVHGEN